LPDSEPQYLRIAELGYWDVYAARCTGDRDPATYRTRIG
jgi:hypothetical protein